MNHVLLTCSPYFVEQALNELRRPNPQVELVETLSPGHLLISAPCPTAALSASWQNRLPIYLHHLFPIHANLPLQSSRNLLRQLEPALHDLAPRLAAHTVTVQVRADETIPAQALHAVQQRLTERYSRGGGRSMPSTPILSIFLTERGAWLGVSTAAENLSPYAGGRIPPSESVTNRAGYKLLEALHSFQIHIRRGDHALDLGAAPGAWTTILRQRNVRVTAVAPTPMYPALVADAGVAFHQMSAEEYLQRCTTQFDVILNDMSLDTQDSARLMIGYAQHLRSEGIVIMTLKLRAHNPLARMDHAFRLLRKQFKIIRVRQLVSNKREVTLFLRKLT